jgi:hypothetical protein
MKKTLLVSSLFLLFWITGCSSLFAGNGTGSNAGDAEIVAGVISLPGGKTASGASIQLWYMDGAGYTLQPSKSTTTDSEGAWSVSHLKQGWWLVQASTQDGLVGTSMVLASDDTSATQADSIVLGAPLPLSGVVFQGGNPVSGVVVSLFNIKDTTDPNGVFNLGQFAAGTYLVNAVTAAKTYTIQMVAGAPETIEIESLPSSLLEDFEQWNIRSRIGDMVGGGWWYANTDQSIGGTSRFVSDPMDSWTPILTETDAWQGTSLHVQVEIDSNFADRYALVGCLLGRALQDSNQGQSWFDLSIATALTMQVRGQGTFAVQWIIEDPNQPGKTTTSTKSFAVNDSWTLVRIPLSEFSNPLVKVSAWNIITKESGELWLDNIRLEGFSPNFWLSLPKL